MDWRGELANPPLIVNLLLLQQKSMQILLVLETFQSKSNPWEFLCYNLLMIFNLLWRMCVHDWSCSLMLVWNPTQWDVRDFILNCGLWLGFTLANKRIGVGWFYKWSLSLWKDSSSFFTLVWDQNSSSIPRWTRLWVALFMCGWMIWFIEGGRGWPYWEKFESLGGGGYHVKLWLTCKIGGGAWW